ncbi:MAG: iron-sulfur cluster carrier protein ApbC [Candidatus Latescibacteria bacterium]|nr:iron-sulfur cluster carrier protein ApbC [Candidatus Latescibacterota bacterium]
MPVTENEVLHALRTVIEPDLKQDLVALNAVRNVTIRGGQVDFEVILTNPTGPQKAGIQRACEEAVRALPGVEQVNVTIATVTFGPSAKDRPAIPGVRHIIAVASGKGGVGKSTVATNLAVALAQTGAAVGLMDADIYGPNIPIMMGVKDRPDTEDERIIPLQSHGLKLMSMGFITGDNVPVIWRGPLVTKMIQKFLHNVAWGDLDYLILDLPPGTGDVQITLRQSVYIAGAVIVTTPQNLALEDVKRGILMFKQVDVPIFGVVENMSTFICPRCKTRTDIFGHGGGLRLCEQMGVPFLSEIPLDPEIRKGGDAGVPIVVGQPDSPQAGAFRKIAAALLAQVHIVEAKRAEQAKLTEGLKVL